MDEAIATCRFCNWTHAVSEPEDGQSLFGTLAWYMRQHESDANHRENNPTRIDWDAMGFEPTRYA